MSNVIPFPVEQDNKEPEVVILTAKDYKQVCRYWYLKGLITGLEKRKNEDVVVDCFDN